MSLHHRHFVRFAVVVHKPQWVMRSTSFHRNSTQMTSNSCTPLLNFRLSQSSLCGATFTRDCIGLGKSSNTITQLPDPWSTYKAKNEARQRKLSRDYRRGDFPNEHCCRFNCFSLSYLPVMFFFHFLIPLWYHQSTLTHFRLQ